MRSGADSSAANVYGPFQASYASSSDPRQSRPALAESERVAREVIRTNRLLASVEPKVNRSGNDKAKDDLSTAVSRQVEARQAMAESQFARAMRLTLEARAYVKSAGTKVGPLEDDPDAVGRALEQTDDALARARDVIEDSGDPRARRSHETLEVKQRAARDLLKEGKTRRAFAETRQVRDGVLQLLRSAELPVSEDAAKKALKRAEHATERAEVDLGARPTLEARRYEREAKAQLQKARVAHARRNYRETLLYAKLVERNLELAVAAQRLALNRNG
jgi:hypothetical protein